MAYVIDKNITAGVSKVEIIFEADLAVKVSIVDNGNGMSREELIKAMIIRTKSPLE